MHKQLDFILSEEVEYHNKTNGLLERSDRLIMTAPTVKTMRYASLLKQAYFSQAIKLRAVFKDEDLKKEDEKLEDKKDGKGALAIIYMGDLDLDKFFGNFKNMIIQGAIKLTNGDNLTADFIDKLSMEDYERMLGEYLENFILGSLLGKAKTQ